MTENWLKGYRYAICIDRWIVHSWWSDAKTVRCGRLSDPLRVPSITKIKQKNLKSKSLHIVLLLRTLVACVGAVDLGAFLEPYVGIE